jgi:hypothetical protein
MCKGENAMASVLSKEQLLNGKEFHGGAKL